MIRCGECGCSIPAEEKHHLVCSGCRHKFSYLNKDVCPRCGLKIEDMTHPIRRHYIYYHCTRKKTDIQCHQPAIERRDLEQQIVERLSRIQISDRLEEWAVKYLQEVNTQESEDRTQVRQSLQKAYNQTQSQLDRLLNMCLSDLISDEEYRQEKHKLLQERARLQEKLGDTEHRADTWRTLAENTFVFARYARYWFEHGSLEDKKTILSALGSNLILKDKKLLIQAKKPFLLIEEGLKSLNRVQAGFEPSECALSKAKSEGVPSLRARWLGIVDSNLLSVPQKQGRTEMINPTTA
jgi:hypothetical protein